jgi:hypothetical protein
MVNQGLPSVFKFSELKRGFMVGPLHLVIGNEGMVGQVIRTIERDGQEWELVN